MQARGIQVYSYDQRMLIGLVTVTFSVMQIRLLLDWQSVLSNLLCSFMSFHLHVKHIRLLEPMYS